MKFHSKEEAVRFCNKVSSIGYIAAGVGFVALMGGVLFGSDFGGFVAFLGTLALSFGVPTGIVFTATGRGIQHAVEND